MPGSSRVSRFVRVMNMNEELTESEKQAVSSLLSRRQNAAWRPLLLSATAAILAILAVLMSLTEPRNTASPIRPSTLLLLLVAVFALLARGARQQIIIRKLATLAKPDLTLPSQRDEALRRKEIIVTALVLILATFLIWNVLY